MIEQPLIERLNALRATTGALGVAGIADLMEAFNVLRVSPWLYVIATSEDAGPNTALSMIVSQTSWQRFDVVAGYTRASLGGAKTDLRALVREGVKAALVGWSHPLSVASSEYRGQTLLRLDVEKQLLFDRISFAYPTFTEG